MSFKLELDKVERTRDFPVIPAGTLVEVVMKIRPGGVGEDGLLKRSSTGGEMADIEFTIRGGEYDKRKFWTNQTLGGPTEGHKEAKVYSEELLVKIFDAVNGLNPKDRSPEAQARRRKATLASFDGATFLATLRVEKGDKRADGTSWPDKNAIGRVLQFGDANYRKCEQPPPSPIQHSTPPAQSQPASAPSGAPAVAAIAPIKRPPWAG
jgi:hypothetical protein